MTYLALKRLAFRRLSIIKFTSSECRYWNQDVKICAVNLCAKIIVEKSDIYIDNVNNYRFGSNSMLATLTLPVLCLHHVMYRREKLFTGKNWKPLRSKLNLKNKMERKIHSKSRVFSLI